MSNEIIKLNDLNIKSLFMTKSLQLTHGIINQIIDEDIWNRNKTKLYGKPLCFVQTTGPKWNGYQNQTYISNLKFIIWLKGTQLRRTYFHQIDETTKEYEVFDLDKPVDSFDRKIYTVQKFNSLYFTRKGFQPYVSTEYRFRNTSNFIHSFGDGLDPVFINFPLDGLKRANRSLFKLMKKKDPSEIFDIHNINCSYEEFWHFIKSHYLKYKIYQQQMNDAVYEAIERGQNEYHKFLEKQSAVYEILSKLPQAFVLDKPE